MERRVGNLLAEAHEPELISPGCFLHLTGDHPKDRSGKGLGDDVAPTIKLTNQLITQKKVKLISFVKQLKFPHLLIYLMFLS